MALRQSLTLTIPRTARLRQKKTALAAAQEMAKPTFFTLSRKSLASRPVPDILEVFHRYPSICSCLPGLDHSLNTGFSTSGRLLSRQEILEHFYIVDNRPRCQELSEPLADGGERLGNSQELTSPRAPPYGRIRQKGLVHPGISGSCLTPIERFAHEGFSLFLLIPEAAILRAPMRSRPLNESAGGAALASTGMAGSPKKSRLEAAP